MSELSGFGFLCFMVILFIGLGGLMQCHHDNKMAEIRLEKDCK